MPVQKQTDKSLKGMGAAVIRLVMADENVTVTEFGRQKHNLEEIFLDLVGGGTTHDKRN